MKSVGGRRPGNLPASRIQGLRAPLLSKSHPIIPGSLPDRLSPLRLLVLAALLFVMAFFPALLLAGPPFFTDDPEPVDFHHWEFYIAAMEARDDFGFSGTAPHFELNYGLAPNLMIHLISALSFDAPRGGRLRYGLGDTELGLKFRFVQETRGRPQVGIFPHVELPTGDSRRGLGVGQVQAFLPIWLQKSWGPWTTYGGGGYWINPGPGNKNYWWFGWEVQRDLSPAVTVGAEVFADTPTAVGESGVAGLNLGTIITLRPRHFILLSAGGTIHGPRALFLYVAYQLIWESGANAHRPTG